MFKNKQSLAPKKLLKDLGDTTQFILEQQQDSGAIPWYKNGKLDPWDHTEAAMALSAMGELEAAQNAYQWLADNQLSDGSWDAQYFTSDTSPLRETNFIAYVATGIWHFYLISQDKLFLERYFPVVERAINFVIDYQSSHGEIAWAVDEHNQAQNDALLTACSSILRSIECACLAADKLALEKPNWLNSGQLLFEAIRFKSSRFDRTWESKNRFAMDWYYPVIAGIYTEQEAQQHLNRRWQEFVVEGLGCKCVNDEPWVTMAETSELVISLCASNQIERAVSLLDTLEQWRNSDGAYWTGYVYRESNIWPEEKTTWTAGAVILAADAIYKISQGSELFLQPSLFSTSSLSA